MGDSLFKSGAGLMSNIANSLGRRASGDAKSGTESSGAADAPVKHRAESNLQSTVPTAAPVPVFHRGPVERGVGSTAKALALEAQHGRHGVSLSEPASDPPTGVHYSTSSLAGRSPITTTLVDATRLSLREQLEVEQRENAWREAEPSASAFRPSGFQALGASASPTAAQALRNANTEFEERVGDRLELPLGILLNQRDRALRDLAEAQQQRLALTAEHEQRVAQLLESHRFETAQLRYAFAAQQAETTQRHAAEFQAAHEALTPQAPAVAVASELQTATELRSVVELDALVTQLRSELDEINHHLKRAQTEREEELASQGELRGELLAEILTLKQEAQTARNEALDLQTRLDSAERALQDAKEHSENEADGLRERIEELQTQLAILPGNAASVLAPPLSSPRPPSHSSSIPVAATPLTQRPTGPWSVTSPKNPPGPMPRSVPSNARPGATLQGVAPPYAHLLQPSDTALVAAASTTTAVAPTLPPAPPSAPQRWGVPAADAGPSAEQGGLKPNE